MAFLGEDIPKLGFGLMRLPRVGNDPEAEIDIEQLKLMVDEFLANGFLYFDTAYGYKGSEKAIGKALVSRYPRESFYLATKIPAWRASSAEEAQQMLYTSLERTGAQYFDFYLLHNIGAKRTHYFDDYKIWDYVIQKKEEGLIKHIGFSLHDHADLLDKILSEHPEVEFVQLQINYADWDNPNVQARLCHETCRKHNVPIVIMEPLRGGALCNLPESVASVFSKANPDASQASWGLKFAATLPNIITVLSGMSNITQMRQNIETFKNMREFSDAEHQTISQAQQALAELPRIDCTDCRYCLDGCPVGVPINGIFESMNKYLVFGELGSARFNYGIATQDGAKASDCIACGACESVCPQELKIIDELARCAEMLE